MPQAIYQPYMSWHILMDRGFYIGSVVQRLFKSLQDLWPLRVDTASRQLQSRLLMTEPCKKKGGHRMLYVEGGRRILFLWALLKSLYGIHVLLGSLRT